MTCFLLVVFDGLRPDMVGPDTTPNLLRFAAMGTRFSRARSVFPSETRVCSASVATGCLPRRHGLVANRIAHPLDPARTVDTGQKQALLDMLEETGQPLLDAPTLADLLAMAGRELVVFSSGTTGQTFVLNPMADAHGQVTVSTHGPDACSKAGRAVLAVLGEPPETPVERAVWIADAWRRRNLVAPPSAGILWLCEPDTTGHYGGLGSEAQRTALRQVDAAFGRLLDDWQSGPSRDSLQIAVASDHGHATVTGLQDVAAAIADQPEFAGCTLLAGSSGGVVVPDADPGRIAGVAGWLMRQEWCGPVYVADGVFAADDIARPEGALPRSLLLADHERAAQVLFTLRGAASQAATGLPGVTLYDGGLAVGAGTHGGLLAAELHTVLLLAGSRIRPGAVSDWPAGLVDIAPTVLALLGLDGAAGMDGRALAEAFVHGEDPLWSPTSELTEAAAPGYRQTLARIRLGPHLYLDEGVRA